MTDFEGVTWHEEFARCTECRHATVGHERPFAINHRKGCSMPGVDRNCPDAGTCHHQCVASGGGACWRVFNAEPLAIGGWGNSWPEDVKRAEMAKVGISAPRPLPLRHGAQLDEAMSAAVGGPAEACARHSVCITAWDSRVKAHTDQQWDEMESGRAVEEARGALIAQGQEDPDEATVLYVALRTLVGGSFSAGLHVGLELAAIAPVERP